MDGKGDVEGCPKPCNRMKFDSRMTGDDPFEKVFGLFVEVEEKIEVLESIFTINEVTLVTRIGGIIGVGKEFIWLILFSISYFIAFHKFIIAQCIRAKNN